MTAKARYQPRPKAVGYCHPLTAKDVLVVGMVLELNNASAALKKAQADAEAMTKDRDEWKALALEAKLLMQDTSKRINEMMQLSDKLLRLVEGGQAKQAVRQQE